MSRNVVHVCKDVAHGPLSYRDLTSGGRGVTGSEQSMLYAARAQARQGHRVVCYLPTDTPGLAEGVELLDIRSAWPLLRRVDSADVVVSWCTADPLRMAPSNALRIYNIQINDFLLNGFGYEQYVDVFVCVSQAHRDHLWTEDGHPGSDAVVEIIPNGVELERFQSPKKTVPGRCVYTSSPDRGLHWLLAIWPEIRMAFPYTELHIFYEVQKWLDNAVLLNSEIGNRARYVVRRVNELQGHGVVMRGPMSPIELAGELLQADLFLYPCDPIRFTEGFSCATLEACAAGAVPVITDADALGEIYGKSGAVVVPRGSGRRWVDDYLEAVLGIFGEERESRRSSLREFAAQFGWDVVANRWAEVVMKHVKP